jgi:hypothetical protein
MKMMEDVVQILTAPNVPNAGAMAWKLCFTRSPLP